MRKVIFTAIAIMAFGSVSFAKSGEVARDCYAEAVAIRDACLEAGVSQSTSELAGLEAMSACLEATNPAPVKKK